MDTLVDWQVLIRLIPWLAAAAGLVYSVYRMAVWLCWGRHRRRLEREILGWPHERFVIEWIERENWQRLKKYMAAGYRLDEAFENGLTPLILAIRKYKEDAVTLFLRRRKLLPWRRHASPHFACKSETTPIAAAVLCKDEEIVSRVRRAGGREGEEWGAKLHLFARGEGEPGELEECLERPGVDRRVRGFDGETALMLAAEKGHLILVERLLEAERAQERAERRRRLERLVDLEDQRGFRAVDYALRGGHPKVVDVLERWAGAPARAGAPPRDAPRPDAAAPAPSAPTPAPVPGVGTARALDPVVQAAAERDLARLRALSRDRADVHGEDAWGRSLLTVAVVTESLEVVDRVLDVVRESGEDLAPLLDGGAAAMAPPLLEAVRARRRRIVARLLEAGADPNVADADGITPLLLACRLGDSGIVEELLSSAADPRRKRVDVNRADADGVTPLLAALAAGRAEVAELLVRAEADLEREDTSGRTPLFLAAVGPPELAPVAEALRTHSDAREPEARLYRAAAAGRADEVAALVAERTDAGIPDASGRPALLVAAEGGRTAVVKTLLGPPVAPGVELDRRDARGNTALLLAAARGHVDVVRELLDHRARLDVRRADGTTPLMAAAERGDLDTVDLLVRRGRRLVDEAGPGGRTALMLASGAGHAHVVERLLDEKASADLTSHTGETALLLSLVEDRQEAAAALREREVTRGELEAQLFFAAAAGKKSEVEKLVAQQADVNFVVRGRSPLMEAIERGHQGVVKVLVEAGADANRRGRRSATPLERAARDGRLRIVKLLLGHGADVDAPGEGGRRPLMAAIERGHKAVVDVLLKNRADVNARDAGGATPLLLGLLGGDPAVVEALRRARATAGEDDARLILAAEAGDAAAVEDLLEHGADPRVAAPGGRAALLGACKAGGLDVVRLLLRGGAPPDGCGASRTPLAAAAVRDEVEVVAELLHFDADLEARGERGRTALHLAAEAGSLAAVRFLAGAGSLLDARDTGGDTPLVLAAREGRTEVALFLLEKGADRTLHGRGGETALVAAAVAGHGAIVEALLAEQAEVQVEAEDDGGATALIRASAFDRTEVVRALLAAGADKDARDDDGDTPLMAAILEGRRGVEAVLDAAGATAGRDEANLLRAAAAGDEPTVRELIGKGTVDVNARRRGGDTALIRAAAGGTPRHAAIVGPLLAAGARPEVRGADGRTALFAAAEAGDVGLVRDLLAHPGTLATVEAVSGGHTAATRADSLRHDPIVDLLVTQAGALAPRATVHLTTNGRKYHRPRCRHVRLGPVESDLLAALADRRPCSLCITNQ